MASKNPVKFTVDFIGIGVEKGGTTWLANVLAQHPDVVFSKYKGTLHFTPYLTLGERNPNFDKGIDVYRSFWPKKIPPKKKVGEFCVSYMYHNNDQAAKKIHELFPNVRLIVNLRNPLDRAYSDYLYNVNYKGFIPKEMSFERAIEKYPFLLDNGLYSEPLKRFTDLFDKKQMKIILLEDIKNDAAKVAKETYDFIGVDAGFHPDLSPVFESAEIKHKRLNTIKDLMFNVLSKIFRTLLPQKIQDKVHMSGLTIEFGKFNKKLTDINTKRAEKSSMAPQTRQKLLDFYRSDVKRLEKLIGRDLSEWMK